MKVILDCERMKYPNTGLFEYCHQLGLALIQSQNKADEVDIYIQKQNQKYFPDNVNFFNQKSIHKYLFPSLGNDIDIWHATHQSTWYLPPKSRNIKRVLTIHDLNFLYEEKTDAKRKNYLKNLQEKINLADHIVAISEFTKNDINKHLNIDKPLTVIYNGCIVEAYPNFDQPTYRPANDFIFALGSVNAKKNFHTLPCLVKNNAMELIIAGNPSSSYVEKIYQEAQAQGVADRVKVIGTITEEDKYWYYKHCSAFALPSIAEGFGIPVIEAMSFGKPVFLSTLTSLPEIGGEHANYFKNFSPAHMIEVFEAGMKKHSDLNLAPSLIQYAGKFNWKRSAEAYWKVYQSLVP